MHLEATEAVSISSESERLEDLGMGEFQENGGVESQVLRNHGEFVKQKRESI